MRSRTTMAKSAKQIKQDAETQAVLDSLDGREEEFKQGAKETLGQIVPILRVDIQPTDVDPANPSGISNMKRVLSAILNDEANKIMVKDEVGNPVGVRNFNEIYPQVVGPRSDGSIQVEYHEQATLGFLGDVMWSLNWFFQHGVLGFPKQTTRAVLQAMGVSFVLESYYRTWLATILDQFNQRGVIPGYVNPQTGEHNWEVVTETIGRNIIVKPSGKFVYSDGQAALATKKRK
jgi:hypothetical protein